MSDRPVPSGEPGQPPTPPQQAPAGGAAPATGVPPQSPSGAFGPASGYGPPPGAPAQHPQQMTPHPVPQPVPPVPTPGPVQPGPVAPQQAQPVQQPAVPQPQPQPQPPAPQAVQPQPPAPQPGPQAFPPAPQQPAQPAVPWQQQGGFPPPAAASGTPDWEALAERNEQAAKRGRRLKLIGAVTAAVVVVAAAGGGYWFLQHKSKDDTKTAQNTGSASPTVSGSTGPSTSSSAPPVKGIDSPPTVGSLPAKTGPAALNLGADAKPGTMAGFSGQVLKLPSGQDSFASTATSVVDVSKSFTVSARVLVDLPNGNRSAISQGDGQYYSYSLGRANNNGHDQWYFKVQVPGGGSAIAWSKGDATVNQWVLLTGVYDDPSGQLTLYVNGAPQSSAKSAGVQPSGTNSLQVGRLSSNSQWADPWHGAVADIQVWGQVLPEADIVKIVAGPSSPPSVPPTGAWLSGG